MKKIICVIVMLLIAVPVYAISTFEKASDSIVKITTTVSVVTVNNKTIASLKQEKAALEVQKVNITSSYNDQIVSLNKQIADIDVQISETKKLGVKEITEAGNVL